VRPGLRSTHINSGAQLCAQVFQRLRQEKASGPLAWLTQPSHPRVLRALTVAYHLVTSLHERSVPTPSVPPQMFYQIALKTIQLLDCRSMPGTEVSWLRTACACACGRG
jgi:hypothetical protein